MVIRSALTRKQRLGLGRGVTTKQKLPRSVSGLAPNLCRPLWDLPSTKVIYYPMLSMKMPSHLAHIHTRLPAISLSLALVLVRDGGTGRSSPEVSPLFLQSVQQVEARLSAHLTHFLREMGLSLDNVPFPGQGSQFLELCWVACQQAMVLSKSAGGAFALQETTRS